MKKQKTHLKSRYDRRTVCGHVLPKENVQLVVMHTRAKWDSLNADEKCKSCDRMANAIGPLTRSHARSA